MIRLIDFAFIIVVAAATSGPKIRIYVSWVTLFVIVVILGSLFYAAKLVFRRVPTLKFVIAISVAFKDLFTIPQLLVLLSNFRPVCLP